MTLLLTTDAYKRRHSKRLGETGPRKIMNKINVIDGLMNQIGSGYYWPEKCSTVP